MVKAKLPGGQCSHVVTIAGRRWPAYRTEQGMIVDMRLFGTTQADYGYKPDKLRAAGVPEHVIAALGDSSPQGFLLHTDEAL